MTTNFSSNLSCISRCHWNERLAGTTIMIRCANPPQLQLPDQQTGHDRLAGAGVVREQEPHARELEQVIVNGLKLVRQRIDAGDRKTEERVELVGHAELVRLQTEPQQGAVAGVRGGPLESLHAGEVSGRERGRHETLAVLANQPERPGAIALRPNRDDPHRFVESRADQNLPDLYHTLSPGPESDCARSEVEIETAAIGLYSLSRCGSKSHPAACSMGTTY